MALVTYTDPIMLDSTGQDIVTQLTRLANTQEYTAGDGININNNVVSTKVASASQLGAIKVGDGLSIDGSTNELSVVVDSALSATSENPVQNKVITNAINAISSMSFEVVQELPTTNIKTNVIYLVPKSTAQTNNTYDEYICLDNTTTPATWEKIGDTQIDLSNYIQKSSTEGLVKNDGTIDTSIGINVSTLNSEVATLQSYMPSGVSAQNTLTTEGTVNNRLATKVDAGNLCFAQFSTSTSYYVGEYVRYNGTIYKCITDHPAGEWNANHFDMAQIYRVLNEKNNTAPEFNVGLNLAVGDYCFRHNKLYRCTNAHFGQWDDSHFTEVRLGDEVKDKANTDDVENLHTVLDDTIGYECINFFSQIFENATVGDLTLTRTLHLHDPRVYYVLTGTWSSPLGEGATFDSPSLTLSAGNYKLSGCPSGGSLTTYTLNVCVANSSPRTTIATDTGDGVEFTLDADTEIILCIGIKNKDAGELTFTPMITRPFYNGDYVKNEVNVLTKIKNITNGTTLDSFGDVETALASKANTSDVPTKDNVIANTKLIKDTVGWSGKNLFHLNSLAGIIHGLTFVDNSDGSFSVSGTATSTDNRGRNTFKLNAGNYILSGITGGGIDKFELHLKIAGTTDVRNYGGETAFTISADETEILCEFIYRNGAVINTTVYPMIRKADILDPTYEPYHDSVEETLRDAQVIEAENLVKLPYDETIAGTGMTATANPDGSISLGGTTTSECTYQIRNRLRSPLKLPAGKYFISGGYSSSIAVVVGRTYNNAWQLLARSESSDEIEFSVQSGDELGVALQINNNTNLNNVVLLPRIRSAEQSFVPLKDSMFPRSEQAVLGASNECPIEATTLSNHDVTLTVDSNNVIDIDGTASADTYFVVNNLNTHLASLRGTRYITLGKDVASFSKLSVLFSKSTSGEWSLSNATRSVTVNLTDAEHFNGSIVIYVANGGTFNHLKLYLQVSMSPNTPYAPYAMTNKELTDAVATIPTVSVSHTGTASSTGVRKQQITVNNVNYDVDGSAYMEQSVTLSTSAATTVTFTNAIIADGKMLTMASSIWDLVPDSMTTAVGSCTITLPKWTSAETIGVRLYVR